MALLFNVAQCTSWQATGHSPGPNIDRRFVLRVRFLGDVQELCDLARQRAAAPRAGGLPRCIAPGSACTPMPLCRPEPQAASMYPDTVGP